MNVCWNNFSVKALLPIDFTFFSSIPFNFFIHSSGNAISNQIPFALLLLLGIRASILEIRCYLSFDFSFSCVFPLCLFLDFHLTLYYYFIFLCFISLTLSFFSRLYLVSISFCLLFIYIIRKSNFQIWSQNYVTILI